MSAAGWGAIIYAFIPAATLTGVPWFTNWTDPVRVAPRLQPAINQFIATSTQPFVPIDWSVPQNELAPKTKPGIGAHLTPTTQELVLNADTQITQGYESRWHYPWSEPVRFKPALISAQQQTTQGLVLNPDTQITQGYESRWHYPWSEPVRLKPGLLSAAQPFFTLPPQPVVSYSWNVPQTDLAPRAKPGLPAQFQQSLAYPTFTPIFENITPDKWLVPWAMPVRFLPRVQPGAQPFLTLPPQPIVSYSWNVPQTDLAPRAKPGLSAQFQQPLAWSTFTPVPESITPDKWYRIWSEPVRLKPGLWPALQMARGEQPLITPLTISITGILSAFENFDTALFGGNMFNPPFRAYVGVIEQGVAPAPTAPTTTITTANVSIRIT